MSDQERYESIAIIKPKDAVVAVASAVRDAVKRDWIDPRQVRDEATPEERIWGAVETVLDLIQHGSDELPPFNLVATTPHHYPNPVYPVNDHPDYLMRRFEVGQVVTLRDPSGKIPSLTSAFAEQYEAQRHRFQTAAKDLFGGTAAKFYRKDPDQVSDIE